jgi:hypothetical protein
MASFLIDRRIQRLFQFFTCNPQEDSNRSETKAHRSTPQRRQERRSIYACSLSPPSVYQIEEAAFSTEAERQSREIQPGMALL